MQDQRESDEQGEDTFLMSLFVRLSRNSPPGSILASHRREFLRVQLVKC